MTTATDELFPRGIAVGNAFCDRERERAQLAGNLLSGRPRHTWISGRRRHGKSSLVAQTLADVDRKSTPRIEHAAVDVFVVHNLKTLDEALREAIGALATKLLPRRRRALDYLGKAFAAFKPELSIGAGGMSLKLANESPSAARIDAMLRALDTAAAHYDSRGVLVIDEFQQISRLDEGHAVEGAIRSVAQSAKALAFVFSGSERTLLAQMFEDRERPLYMLCDHVDVGRIPAAPYRKFLSDAVRLQWNVALSDQAVEALLACTERHPFYVNALARALWDEKAAHDSLRRGCLGSTPGAGVREPEGPTAAHPPSHACGIPGARRRTHGNPHSPVLPDVSGLVSRDGIRSGQVARGTRSNLA